MKHHFCRGKYHIKPDSNFFNVPLVGTSACFFRLKHTHHRSIAVWRAPSNLHNHCEPEIDKSGACRVYVIYKAAPGGEIVIQADLMEVISHYVSQSAVSHTCEECMEACHVVVFSSRCNQTAIAALYIQMAQISGVIIVSAQQCGWICPCNPFQDMALLSHAVHGGHTTGTVSQIENQKKQRSFEFQVRSWFTPHMSIMRLDPDCNLNPTLDLNLVSGSKLEFEIEFYSKIQCDSCIGIWISIWSCILR